MLDPQSKAELEKGEVLHPTDACLDPPDPVRGQWRGLDSGAFDDNGTCSQPGTGTIACSLNSTLDSLETQP
jgi:hypothetical protein